MEPQAERGGVVEVPEAGLPVPPAEQAVAARLAADPRVARVIVPCEALRARVAALAEEIAAAYAGAPALEVVVVLKGALAFAKDLGEALFAAGGPEVRYRLVKASTYGLDIKGGGEAARPVTLELRPEGVAGADVLLVDDLVDQGYTLAAIRRHLLAEAGARSVRACVLLEKRVARDPALAAALALDYVGFRVPDRWVAGYGIDAAEDFRNLPCVVIVNEEHYRHER